MEKIIERVQKLLQLAGNNPNENEALAALEKAHSLLAEHNLSMESVGAHKGKPSEEEIRDSLHTDTNMPERYNRWIWQAVADANSCLLYFQRPNPKKYQTIYSLVGRRVNIVVATQMALYLCQTMKRLCAEEVKRTGRNDHAYKNAYLVGMATRLYHRINELKAKQDAARGGNALVLWSGKEAEENKKFLEEDMKIKLRKSKAVTKIKYDRTAMLAGERDAEKVNLSQQVGSSHRPMEAIA